MIKKKDKEKKETLDFTVAERIGVISYANQNHLYCNIVKRTSNKPLQQTGGVDFDGLVMT